MNITKKEIKKIAELARLQISEEEATYYTKELSAVLEYADQLSKLDTESVEPMAQATALFSVFRKDKQIEINKTMRERIVKNVLKAIPFRDRGFARVKSVFNRTNNK